MAGRLAVFLILLLGAGGLAYLGWQWWRNRPVDGTQQAAVAPCSPSAPEDGFQLSNPHSLAGSLDEDTYFAGGEEYAVADNATLTVPAGVTLLIEPGARVKFGENAKLVVHGLLLACGRENRRILFTADAATGQPGFWIGIELDGADPDSVLGHATFEFAGRDAHAPLWLQDTDLHVEDIRFDSNGWYALSLDPDSFPGVRPPIVIENGPAGWEVRGGEMTTQQTWQSDQAFVINGDLEVSAAARLTLTAGTWLKFQPRGSLRIEGELDAAGTAALPVVLTSVNELGEDTAPDPAAGDWGGVQLIGRAERSTLTYVEIRYAGDIDRQPACLFLEDAAPVITQLTIAECGGYALSTDLLSEPAFDDLTLPGTELASGWELRGGTVTGNLSRTIRPIPTSANALVLHPIVTGWIGVEAAATLQVAAGAHILFRGGGEAVGLWAEGELQLGGTEDEPVVLTSWLDPTAGGEGGAAAGDWGGVHLAGSQPVETVFGFVEIRYGGGGDTNCLQLTDAAPAITNLQIANCDGYPVSSDAASTPQVGALELLDNPQGDWWEIRESTLSERRDWVWANLTAADGSPITRIVTGLVTIEEEAVLTLQPGLILKFTGNAGLLARGSLLADGTEAQPIRMTSWRDPEGGGTGSGGQPGDWGGVILEGRQTLKRLVHVDIRYAGDGNRSLACLNLSEAAATLESVRIAHCAFYPVSSDLNSDPQVSGLTLEDNQPANEWALRGSDLAEGAARVWDVIPPEDGTGQIIRTVLDWISIPEGAQLAIRPGVVIKFRQNAGLWAGGALQADGAVDRPVVFTSWRDPEFSREAGVQAGDWTGIVLEGSPGNSRLQHTEIRYAGANRNPRGALILAESSPGLTNLLVRDSAWYPLSQDLQSLPRMESISFQDNLPANAVEIRAGELGTSGEYVLAIVRDAGGGEVIRVVTGLITVAENATLRLETGVVLKFEEGGKLVVEGGLLADGAVFTSIHDDAYGGDTEGNSSGETVWQGIELHSPQLARLVDSRLRYAGTGLWMENAAPVLTNLVIESSEGPAISADFASTPVITGLTLTGNGVNGLLLRGDALPAGETRWERIGTEVDQIVRVLQETLVIGPDLTLILDPGVVVKFMPEAGLLVEGDLHAGQPGESAVVFTSFADDEYGGDTDGVVEEARRGAWLGVTVNPDGTGAELALRSVRIRYATIGLHLTALEDWVYAELVIEHSQFYGLSCDASIEFDPETEALVFSNNGEETLSCPTPDREE